FGAEEQGIRGSRAFVAHPPFPLDKISFMINMDMLGRNFFELEYGDAMKEGLGAIVHLPTDSLQKLVFEMAPKHGLSILMLQDSFLQRFGKGFFYDSKPFNAKGIPTLFFSTSLHKDYHRPSDTVEKIRFDKLTRTGAFILAILEKSAIGERDMNTGGRQ
ncbi:M28 family peptidase, partial [Myxococcota bacterium]|nr:M28 family peptidase [Myxococcota bacterium]